MSSTSSSTNNNTQTNGASYENLNKMNYHLAALELCANAYFRDIQRGLHRGDYDLELRFNDWNYVQGAMERITDDFAERLAARAQQTTAIIPTTTRKQWEEWQEARQQQYGNHDDSDWQRRAPRTIIRAPRNFVEPVRPEALWYEPSNEFETPGHLMTERPAQISPASSSTLVATAKPAKIKLAKTMTTTPVAPKASTGAKQESGTRVPPHLRGSRKENLAFAEVNVKLEPISSWVAPHLRGAPTTSKTLTLASDTTAPAKARENHVPPHLRGAPKPMAEKVSYQKRAPVTPPRATAAAPTPGSDSTTNSPVASSESSGFDVLIDVSDITPSTVFDTSAQNEATHGTTDVWEALMQLK